MNGRDYARGVKLYFSLSHVIAMVTIKGTLLLYFLNQLYSQISH